MLKKNGAPDPSTIHTFKHHWPNIQPIIRKLIFKEPIGIAEWQNLFYDIHMICSWDTKGSYKLLKNLEFELRDSYITRTQIRLKSIEDGQQQLKEYIDSWNDFRRHCDRFPVAFQQLDLATRGIIAQFKSYPLKSNGAQKCSNDNTKTESHTYRLTHYKKQNDSTVRCLMLKLWNEQIVKPLEKRLQESAKQLIWTERSGLIVDSQLIVGLRESFTYLDEFSIIYHHSNYMQLFKTTYIEAIEIFYSSRADEYLREHGVIEYIKWALCKLQKEEQKAIQYLDTNYDAVQRAGEACGKVLIANFVEQMLVASTKYIRSNDVENMKLIFRFFNRLEGVVERFLEQLNEHIVSSGLSHLLNSSTLVINNPDKFVEKLLDIHNQFSQIIADSLENDHRARLLLDKAFGRIVNDTQIFNAQDSKDNSENNTPTKTSTRNSTQPESRCAELLANYCNLLFRRSTFSRKLTDEDLTKRLNELLLIVKLLKNKDAFLKFHKLHLMRRLILDASINCEKEEEFVISLKEIAEVPMEQINELLRMFKDLKSSEILQNNFLRALETNYSIETVLNNNNNNTLSDLTAQVTAYLHLQDNNNRSPANNYNSIHVKVLNPSAWIRLNEKYPICSKNEINLMMSGFEAFYKSQYDGRELEWCQHLSNGVIVFSNDKGGKFDLEVTAAQLAILTAFNDQPRDSKTIKELESASNLGLIELRRTLWVSSLGLNITSVCI